jgi:tRNA-binding protein
VRLGLLIGVCRYWPGAEQRDPPPYMSASNHWQNVWNWPAYPMVATMSPAPIKPTISLDQIYKVDVRVGTILAVEDVINSEKLVRLRVDFGDHKRTILVGMKKERKNPKAEIEGKQALFVVNLEPRKMAGEISEGTIFDLGYADGIAPVLATRAG